jgi:predicted acetyltransferase
MTSSYKIIITSKQQLNELIQKNKNVYQFMIHYRDYYLTTLSPKFKGMNIEDIVSNEKKYFLSEDSVSQLYYILCVKEKKVIGMCKIIWFSSEIRNIDFFYRLAHMYKIDTAIYAYGAYVIKDERNNGACTKMLDYIMEFANNFKIKTIITDIKQNNVFSIRSNLSAGFKQTNLISRPPDVYFFILQL